MGILQQLLEPLKRYSPVVVRDSATLLTSCRLVEDAPLAPEEVCLHTILIVRGAEAALARASEPSNCLFVLSDCPAGRFSGCAASVVQFPAATDAKELFRRTLPVLRDAMVYESAQKRLSKVLLDREGLEPLVNLAEDILDAPLAVFSIASAPIAMGKRFRILTGDAALREYREKGYISFQFAEGNMYRDFLRTLETAGRPFTFRYPDAHMLPRRVHKLYLNGAFVAHCSMILARPLTETEDAILAFLARLVTMELERTSYTPYKHTPQSLILQGLLNSAYHTEQAVSSRLQLYHWTPHRNFYVLNVPRQRSPGSHVQHIPSILLQDIYSRLQSKVSTMFHLIEPNRILFLLDAEQPRILEDFREQLNASLTRDKILGALSHRFTKLLEFKHQVDHTRRLIRAAAQYGVSAGLVDADSLFFPHLLYSLGPNDLKDFCLSEVLELHAQGSAAQELLDTVRVYLDAGSDGSLAAERLFIHRNTLLRRLAKFKELTGLDLTSGATRCKLFLSLQFLDASGD